jgi:hypothetical protein
MRGLPSVLFFRVYGLVREGQLKDCHFRARYGFGAGCCVCNKGMENVQGRSVVK